jgi:hypothetical protein
MAGKISSFASGVQSSYGTRATSRISTNSRAQTTRGYIGLVTDVISFPGLTGLWFMPNQRVRVNNIPTVGINSVGIWVRNNGIATGTMIVVEGDGRGNAM